MRAEILLRPEGTVTGKPKRPAPKSPAQGTTGAAVIPATRPGRRRHQHHHRRQVPHPGHGQAGRQLTLIEPEGPCQSTA